MSEQFVLEVTDLRGSSTLSGYQGAFSVTGWSFTGANAGSISGGGAGADTPPTDFTDLTVTFPDETGLAAFLQLVADGVSKAAASLIAVDTSAGVTESFRLNLAEVVVIEVQDTAGDGYAATLHYRKLGIIQATQGPSGQLGTPSTFGYDTVLDHQTAPPPGAVPGALAGAVGPEVFYMLIPGADGGSHAAGHEHWFELTAFDLEAFRRFTPNGDVNLGESVFDPLVVRFGNASGLTRLLADLAAGADLSGVRVEGVNGQGATTYKLDLGDVQVRSVAPDQGGYSASFDYDKITLTTRGQAPDGSLQPAQTMSWNIATARPGVGDIVIGAPSHDGPIAFGNTFYLEVNGVGGPATDKGHAGAFKVTGFDFGAESLDSTSTGETGSTTAKTQFGEIHVTVDGDAGLAAFLARAASGQLLSAASLIGAGPMGETFRLNLSHVQVTDVEETEDGGYRLALAYDAIGVLAKPQADDGSLQPALTFGYNLGEAKAEPPPGDATPGPHTPGAVASKFFLLIDGVDGGSTDAHHQGWFEIPGFEFDVQALLQAATGGGASVGKTDFSPLAVDLPDLSGIAKLLDKLATGHAVKGVRLEGVTAQGDTVYVLNLADVFVRHLAEDDQAGYRAEFDYTRIAFSSFAQADNGAYGPTGTFTWNLGTQSADVGSLPGLSPTHEGGLSSGTQFFLEVSGLGGPSTAVDFAGAFQVTGYSFDATAVAGSTTGGGGAGAGKTDISDVTVTLPDETGLSAFLQLLASGEHRDGASLIGAQGAKLAEVYRVNLGDVSVVGVHETDAHGYEVTLHFARLGVVAQTQAADGSAGAPQAFGFDIATAQKADPPPNATPGPAAPPVGAAKYFLLVDGVDGGSTDAHHQGWFELSGFELDGDAIAALSGGGGGAKVDFDLLSVQLAGETGLTRLLNALAGSTAIKGIRIEGVSALGQKTYVLDLADVYVRQVDEDQARGYGVGFEFGRMALSLYGQKADGSYAPAGSFTLNTLTGGSDIGQLPSISPTPPDTAPVAQAASATTAEDTPLKGSVTATDADGDALTFALVTGPSHGTLSLGANGAYTYTPAANYNGADSFSFRASDGTLTSPAATVTLNVTPVNDAPTAGNDAGAAPEDGARVFTWAELFANDADVDANDPLTIVSVQAGRGSVTLDAAARTVTYHADHDDFDFLANGATTADSFTYTLRDQGGLTATGTVVMTVTGIADAATQSGSTKSDVLSGGAGEDSIDAGNGADSVTGGPGADTLGGGTGEDQLAGGDGRDSLAGAQGQDTLLGGAGTDTLQGDEGDDRLDGGAGSDRLTGGVGDDSFVFGGAAPRPGEVDVVTDFRKGEDHIVLTDGVTLTSTTLTDATGDGAADTVLLLSNGVTVVLAGYTGSLAGYIV